MVDLLDDFLSKDVLPEPDVIHTIVDIIKDKVLIVKMQEIDCPNYCLWSSSDETIDPFELPIPRELSLMIDRWRWGSYVDEDGNYEDDQYTINESIVGVEITNLLKEKLPDWTIIFKDRFSDFELTK